MTSTSHRRSTEKRSPLSIMAACVGIASCAEILLAFLVHWFESDVFTNSDLTNQYEYGLLGFWSSGTFFHEYPTNVSDMAIVGDLMSEVTIIVVLALIAAILALVLSALPRRVPGVVAGLVSSSLLLLAGAVFYFGIIDALGLDTFSGYSYLNRTRMLTTGPGPGFLIAIAAPVVQATQAVFLWYSRGD